LFKDTALNIAAKVKVKRLKPTTYIAPQTANCSCSGALRHRQNGL